MTRVAIVGAGAAGLSAAKVLSRAGYDVVVYDSAPDLGGVWSSTRRYPGVTTQSPRDTYTFTDFPMPDDYPEWPSGEQVQDYFIAYAREFDLDRLVRLSIEVTHARPTQDGWALELRGADGVDVRDEVDHLIIANGVFSKPVKPTYAGEDQFLAAGGRIEAACEFTDVESARDQHVVVVGYGKSACDVAREVSRVAASTDVVARKLLWKVPRKVRGVVNFKYLLLTRMGEALFRWEEPRGMERFLHGPGNPIRRNMLNSVGKASVKQFGLDRLDLVPAGTMEGIVRGSIGLTTDGFFEAVAEGSITVRRDRLVSRLLVVDGERYAELDDGTRIRADLVLCGTGYTQSVSFLDPQVQTRLTDEDGNFLLYRQVLPLDVPHLTFAGYNSSFFSPLNAEMGALWTAAVLAGQIQLPDPGTMRERVTRRIAFMDEATGRHHQKGTKIIPFSLHNVDEILADFGVNLSPVKRASQWLVPVLPISYRRLTAGIERQLAGTGQESRADATANSPTPT